MHLDEVIHGYNFTVDNTHGYNPAPVPFVATVDVKITNQAGKPPFQLTNERILTTLSALAAVYAMQRDMNKLVEWDFDLVCSDPWPTKLVTIAKGSITQPLLPPNGSDQSVATS